MVSLSICVRFYESTNICLATITTFKYFNLIFLSVRILNIIKLIKHDYLNRVRGFLKNKIISLIHILCSILVRKRIKTKLQESFQVVVVFQKYKTKSNANEKQTVIYKIFVWIEKWTFLFSLYKITFFWMFYLNWLTIYLPI